MGHEPDQRFRQRSVVSVGRAKVRGVARNAGTGSLDRIVEGETSEMDPRHAQVIAMVERPGRQRTGEECVEECVVCEVVSGFHGDRYIRA
ncbi:hypothetical protein GWC77_18710 [Paraburkholderia sp. NMBU_R16]|uniref:hypothetical protein n=1 Tax=Paraburkholderia sp. NMBU_R16 TaxID=2698676 RepID=UPI001563A371|nr:hypothetical protein [Paraburkholderia sp. NMBU_R16]NRO97959.1 hypothetical protein [Paraburkholderia sp. NMBU_R16]